jgi:hypothetical protein
MLGLRPRPTIGAPGLAICARSIELSLGLSHHATDRAPVAAGDCVLHMEQDLSGLRASSAGEMKLGAVSNLCGETRPS